MLELIAIVCGLILVIFMPIEAKRVRSGVVRKNFKGTADDYRAAYLKQVNWFMWLGVGIGVANVAIAPLNLENGEWVFKLIGAAVWFAVAVMAFRTRAQLAQKPA
jgi:hypothetical protein